MTASAIAAHGRLAAPPLARGRPARMTSVSQSTHGSAREHADHVQVRDVQQHEAAERKRQGAEGRARRVHAQEPLEQQHGPREQDHVVEQQLEVEGGLQRKPAVEQPVERVKRAALALAVDVGAGENGRRPQHRVAGVQRLPVERTQGDVKPAQVGHRHDAAADPDGGERREERRSRQPHGPSDQRSGPAARGSERHATRLCGARPSSPHGDFDRQLLRAGATSLNTSELRSNSAPANGRAAVGRRSGWS